MALPVIPASGPIDLASLRDGLGLTGEISMSHTGVRSLAKKVLFLFLFLISGTEVA